MTSMKIKFDANQQFQLDAIQAVVDVFDGQPRAEGQFEIRLGRQSWRTSAAFNSGTASRRPRNLKG